MKNIRTAPPLSLQRISLASYSFHGLLDEEQCDIYSYIASLKYRYHVEWADIWTGFIPTPDKAYAKLMRTALDDNGIGLANLCVDGPHLWSDDAGERVAHKKVMLEFIEVAGILGAKTVRIDFGGKEGHTMPAEAFDYIVATYKEYCGVCADMGIRIGPENHWGWDRVPEYLEKVRAAVDHPAYGHLYHFGNFFDEPERGHETALKYAMHTHIAADMVPQAKEIMRQLHEGGYAGTYSVEHHSAKFEPVRVEWQLAAVRNAMLELMEEGTEKPAGPDYIASLYAARQ